MSPNCRHAPPLSPLERIFSPSSIAIVGASETPGKAGERRTRSILEGGFTGDVYPVNPRRESVFGRRCFPSLLDIEADAIDLVLVIVEPDKIPDIVAQCCTKRAAGVAAITAGRREMGEFPSSLDQELVQILKATGTRLIGPNCSGLFNAASSLNCLGIPGIKPGPLSVVSQSGNVIDSLIYFADRSYTGFSKIVGIGNSADLEAADYLDFLGRDPHTEVILCYIEGFRDGGRFIEAARRAVQKKPVIAIKVGETSAGRRAAAAHTASIVGQAEVTAAALKQAGVLRADNPDEMFTVAHCLAACSPPAGNRVAILSEGGGDNAMAADNAALRGLSVPVFSEELQERLRPLLLPTMPASNPVDYGGRAEENPLVIAKCVRECLASDEVDGIYITGFFGGFKTFIAPSVEPMEIETAEELLGLRQTFRKPIIVHSTFANSSAEAIERLKRGGIPVLESSHRAALALSNLARYASFRNTALRDHPIVPAGTRPAGVKAILSRAATEGREALMETESREILSSYGIPLVPAEFADTASAAAEAAKRLGLPAALKVVSPDIIHKSDAGGVILNLQCTTEVHRAFEEIISGCRAFTDRDRIRGVLVSPMCAPGVECIVGMTRDPAFGPVLAFGLGGVLVELLRDVSLRILPLRQDDLQEMIDETSCAELLRGHRGSPPCDIPALRELIERVSFVILQNPEIAQMDLNPVTVHKDGVTVLDSRIIIG